MHFYSINTFSVEMRMQLGRGEGCSVIPNAAPLSYVLIRYAICIMVLR